MGLLSSFSSGAQTQPQAAAASAPSAPSDYAKRQADSPFRWIMINGANADKKKPLNAKPVAAAKEPIAAASAVARQRPVPVSVQRADVPASDPAGTRAGVEPAAATPAPAIAKDAADAPPALAVAQTPASAAVEPAPLRIFKRVLPEPPDRLISANAEDRVLVQFTVLPDGSVGGAKIASSTNARLNSYVLGAVEQWRYASIDNARPSQAGFVFRR